ncbi:hypothetical protein AN403_6203 [Pseudomonas fluorescens]|uniref:Uncharacterized protein n=1 Tax=Pseudomonas fluorescens TaxID=294 RepID=A0A0P8ZWR0_PSEFL|nr:hypothetical protein AN403_6203 [Pseudomonas fluorescens]
MRNAEVVQAEREIPDRLAHAGFVERGVFGPQNFVNWRTLVDENQTQDLVDGSGLRNRQSGCAAMWWVSGRASMQVETMGWSLVALKVEPKGIRKGGR